MTSGSLPQSSLSRKAATFKEVGKPQEAASASLNISASHKVTWLLGNMAAFQSVSPLAFIGYERYMNSSARTRRV